MYLTEIFDRLTASEMSQLSVGGQPQGVINQGNHKIITTLINAGMLAIYTRFPLYMKTQYITLDGTLDLPITDAHVFKIEKVSTDKGVELSINDETDKYSVYTEGNNVLRIPSALANQTASTPDPLKTTDLLIKYRTMAAPLGCPVGGFVEPELMTIDLPDQYLTPLVFYIGALLHQPLGTDNVSPQCALLMNRFEGACRDLENKGLTVDLLSQNSRLRRGGWV